MLTLSISFLIHHMRTTIGILLPRSTYYETIGFEIYNGLKTALDEIGITDSVRIVSENIGFGSDKQQCYRAAERLLLDENASIVIAYTGHRGAQLLRPLFLAMNRLLIVLDAGANLPHEAEYSANILYHSFHNSLGAWLSAKKAVTDGFNQGAMITGYYDGGYLHTVAITEGFVRNGGQIMFNVATGFKPETFSMEESLKHLEAYPDSALLTLFSGDFIQWYFKEMNRLHKDKQLPIYLSPFGMEEQMLEEAEYPGEFAQGVVTWSRKIDNELNYRFLECIKENTGLAATYFHLMGWESALLIQTILRLQGEMGIKPVSPELQKNIVFDSPRGTIRVSEKLNTTYGPMYHARIIPSDKNTCLLELGEPIDSIDSELDELSKVPLNDVETAWYNSYVCI